VISKNNLNRIRFAGRLDLGVKRMRAIALAVIASLVSGCNAERVQIDAETAGFLKMVGCPIVSGTYQPATIPELIASPDRLDRQAVRISGYIVSSFEHSAIYPTPQDPFLANKSAGLWTEMSVWRAVESDKRVTVRGVYIKGISGHGGQWPGSLCVHSIVADGKR
jgi:hypothetical protein